jgi:hypothetical protein
MTKFVFRVAHLHPVAAIIAAHGATDVSCCRWPTWYTLCCLAPMPPTAVTCMFASSSLVHFAQDMGPNGSVALHALVGVVALLGGSQAGLEIMSLYLACIHTPLHYARCWRRKRWVALACAALTTCFAFQAMGSLEVVTLGHTVQRIVCAHVWTEWSIGRRSRARVHRLPNGC